MNYHVEEKLDRQFKTKPGESPSCLILRVHAFSLCRAPLEMQTDVPLEEAYAPKFSPVEYVWNQTNRALAKSAPTDLLQLNEMLRNPVRCIRGSPPLLWSRIHASDLPWAR